MNVRLSEADEQPHDREDPDGVAESENEDNTKEHKVRLPLDAALFPGIGRQASLQREDDPQVEVGEGDEWDGDEDEVAQDCVIDQDEVVVVVEIRECEAQFGQIGRHIDLHHLHLEELREVEADGETGNGPRDDQHTRPIFRKSSRRMKGDDEGPVALDGECDGRVERGRYSDIVERIPEPIQAADELELAVQAETC